MTAMTLLPAAKRIAAGRGVELPDDMEYGLRSVHADFTSSHGFRWPFPGSVAKAAGPCLVASSDPCPQHDGDGLCAALTWSGMASGGIPATTVLLVAWARTDVLARSDEKLRVRKALVLDVTTPGAMLAERQSHEGLDLCGADLSGADLTRADLYGAVLYGADLTGANLTRAVLSGADLYGADLTRADLYGAVLTGAVLSGAVLTRAVLTRADLSGANLRGANLSGANLRGAELSGANLRGAYLTGADLTGANNVPAGVTAT